MGMALTLLPLTLQGPELVTWSHLATRLNGKYIVSSWAAMCSSELGKWKEIMKRKEC